MALEQYFADCRSTQQGSKIYLVVADQDFFFLMKEKNREIKENKKKMTK